jgi:hypothetical protein
METFNNHTSVLQLGERNGVINHIDDVENGINCNCSCSYCGNRLVAKNAGLKKMHHFAHFSGVECGKAIESAVHKLAKQVFYEIKKLLLPPCEGFGPRGLQEYISATIIDFDEVVLEKNAPTTNAIIRPDAIGYVGMKQIFVEFCYTHGVSKEKQNLIEQNNTSCVEIILNPDLQHPGRMKAFLLQSIESKRWIFHRALKRLIKEHTESEKIRLEQLRRKQLERDKQRRMQEEAKKRRELERIKRLVIKDDARKERELLRRQRELAEAETKGNLYRSCPVVNQFLEKFYQTRWGQNNVIKALRKGVWFQSKIFYYWPEKEIDIFVDQQRHILVPKKADYDQLPEELRLYHEYLLKSVQKYDKLYRQSLNHCSFCNMFVGNCQEFIICKYNRGDDVAGCLNYDNI